MTVRHLMGSLRGRLTLAIGLGVLIATILVAASASRLFSSHVEQQFHEELEVHMAELTRLVEVSDQGRPMLTRALSDPRYEQPRSGFYWQVNRPGQPVLRSESLVAIGPQARLSTSTARGSGIRHGLVAGPTGPAETYGLAQREADGLITYYVIATDERFLLAVQDQFDRELTVMLAAFAVIFSLLMWLAIRFALAPVDRLSSAVSAVRTGSTDKIAGQYPNEISPLVDNLNGLILETRDLVQHGRVVAGNLAHSLRTPLAIMHDEAEQIEIGHVDPASSATMLRQLRAMQVQIDYHLARANTGSAHRLTGITRDVPEAIAEVTNALRRLYPGRDIQLSIDPVEAIVCDSVDFREILANLVDNAMRHGVGDVAVLARTDGESMALFAIENQSARPSDTNVEDWFAIGHSGGQSSGLGLPLARELARRYGGDVTITTMRHGDALRVSTQLTMRTA